MGSSVVTNAPSPGAVGHGGGCACVGLGSIWEISVLSFQFCYATKTALKIVEKIK